MEKGTEKELIQQETGMEICGGNREIYLQILALMLSYEGEKGQKLKEDYKSQKWKSFGNEAHALKSSAAGIGAMALSEAARTMENAVDESDFKFLEENQEDFFQLLQDTIKEIHVILDK